jgi:serine/threonine protein kinase
MFWSPELFRAKDREYFVDGEAQDTWALGVTFFMMLTGKSPFKSTQFHPLKEEIGGHTEVTIPDTLSLNVQRLLRFMLQKDQRQRYTLLQVRLSSLLA